MKKNKKLKVIELFAGVGGFRIGLEGMNGKSASSKYKENIDPYYIVNWSNQFEPGSKLQLASLVYKTQFPSGNHSNKNIEEVDIAEIPIHDVLVGGFPCQDYSVASLLKNSHGLLGKKGVLWWQIYRILDEIQQKPNYLILENVDRLIKSPSKQRGRDFAIMLASLNDLGYAVEWRIINAADYGFPQKRKRIFILAYKENSKLFKKMINNDGIDINKTLLNKTFKTLEIDPTKIVRDEIKGNTPTISKTFNRIGDNSPFCNTGVCWNRFFQTVQTKAVPHEKKSLRSILQKGKIPLEFFVEKEIVHDKNKGWAYYKNSKQIQRVDKATGHQYWWSEGNMRLTEDLDEPARTIITSEGGFSPSRSRHLIEVEINKEIKYRRLTPIELENANMFPKNHTMYYRDEKSNELVEVNSAKRAFFMGNALVIGVVEKIGKALYEAQNK